MVANTCTYLDEGLDGSEDETESVVPHVAGVLVQSHGVHGMSSG